MTGSARTEEVVLHEQHVDFRTRSLHSLCIFLLCVAPCVGPFVKEVAWDHDSILEASWNWKDGGSPAHFFPKEKPVIKHAEWLTGVDLKISIFDRRLRSPGLFISLILPYCPNLNRLNFSTFLRHKTFDSQEGEDIEEQWVDHAFEAVLRDIPPEQITKLVLRFEYDLRAHQVDLPRLFQRFTHLRTLDMEDVSMSDEWHPAAEHPAIFRLLSELPNLRIFVARNLPVWPGARDLDLPSSITRLSLRRGGPIYLSDFATLVNSLSSSLESLECGSILWQPGNIDVSPTFFSTLRLRTSDQGISLPFLRHLSFHHEAEQPSILPLFSEAPITSFTLLGMHRKVRHEALSFISTLAAKRPRSLCKVNVLQEDLQGGSFITRVSRGKGEVDAVKMLCEELNVRCEVVEERVGEYEQEWSPSEERRGPRIFAFMYVP
ncbi:hypothetical protein JCM11251_002079 [Rhodosporidiobolus azoricus]